MLNNDNNKRINQIRMYMIIGYAVIIILAIVFISAFTFIKTDEVLRSKVSTITSALNSQMKLNINSYLTKLESTGALIFASDEVYEYDATDTSIDQYDALNTEKIISDKLYDLCIMENYVDFGIVYSNNHTVGKISNGTSSLFGESIYEELAKIISRQRTNDGWSVGYGNDFKRVYYVKRVNENAVLVASFYSSELENVFERSDEMKDMTVRLILSDNSIIYSSDNNEKPGDTIPDDIKSRIEKNNSATIMDNQYLITVTGCADNWYVICSIPSRIILSEINEIIIYTIIIASVAILLAIALSALFSVKATKPVSSIVTSLDTQAHIDNLTGIYNKHYFEESAVHMIESANSEEHHALILLDIDNFKGVNDTLGHAYGDKVLAEVGNILRNTFTADDCKGRIGGDEFCVFLKIPSSMQYQYAEFVKKKCENLCKAFNNNYTGSDGKYKISASIGVAILPDHGKSFDELYKCADSALYASKHKGKDTYTICNLSEGGDNQ